ANTGVTISTNQDLNNLSQGTYNITVTDINSCEKTETVFIDNIIETIGVSCKTKGRLVIFAKKTKYEYE
ncbi:MAG: hypothetical protein DRJ01_18780, partial [Bacteroidetes bacterium]